MWLVLSSSSDASGIWAWQGLKQWGLSPLEFVTAESLASCSRWEHRLHGNAAQLKLTLSDGRVLDGSGIRGVLNRLHAPSPLAFQSAAPSDREYAQAELFAFYLSWLNSLSGVMINRPTPLGLSGPWLHPSEWMVRAAKAGLRTPVYRQSSRDSETHSHNGHSGNHFSVSHQPSMQNLIAFGGEIFGGAVPADVAQACGRLLKDVEAGLLGIDLYMDDQGRWTFASANPAPDLRLGGMPLLGRLAQILVLGERP
jgi:hypothetical protein